MSDYNSKISKQSIEPAVEKHIVIFTGGVSPLPKATENYWKSNLVFSASRKPDIIIAADSGLETFEKYKAEFCNFFDDAELLITGDFDSLKSKKLLEKYPSDSIETFPAYKDYTDTELALRKSGKILSSFQGAKTFVTLVGGSGGRSDHFIGIFSLFGTCISPDAWITEEQVLYNLSKPCEVNVKKLAEKQYVSVSCNFFDREPEFSADNLEWENFMPYPMYSLSNRMSTKAFSEGKDVKFNLKKGSLVLYLPLGADVSISCGNDKSRS